MKNDVVELIQCGIDAVRVERLFQNQEPFDLQIEGRIQVLAVGKAAIPMTRECLAWLERSGYQGQVDCDITVPHQYRIDDLTDCYGAGHPKPDQFSSNAGKRVLSLAKNLGQEDLLICLISGGGSALWAQEVDEITPEDLRQSTELFLTIGTDIMETNAVRSRLTTTGAGKLSIAAHPARIMSLAISDVPGDLPNVIASGPTSRPNSISFLNEVMKKYQLDKLLPATVSSYLSAYPKIDTSNDFDLGIYQIIGSNDLATEAATRQAKTLGYECGNAIELKGDVIEMAREIGSIATKKPKGKKCALLFGGETTVKVSGDGIGGRNQELVLASVLSLRNLGRPYTFAAAGTDGIDGFSDAAGAWIDQDTISKANARGLDIEDFLTRNDSHHFFKALEQQIVTGPTHTNVMDIAVLLLG